MARVPEVLPSGATLEALDLAGTTDRNDIASEMGLCATPPYRHVWEREIIAPL